jgi:hypothetical protein
MRLVVLRFSALGDVTLLVPVLQHLATLHPDKRITVVSRPHLAPLYAPLPVDFFPANLKGQHQGIMGLWRLARQIHRAYRREGYQVFDQHAVLRTYLVGKGLAPAQRPTRPKNPYRSSSQTTKTTSPRDPAVLGYLPPERARRG